MSRRALVLLCHDRRFQALSRTVLRESSHLFQLEGHEPSLMWYTMHTDLAFLTPLSVMMMCSSVMGDLPTQIPWPHFWSRLRAGTAVYLYSTLSSKR